MTGGDKAPATGEPTSAAASTTREKLARGIVTLNGRNSFKITTGTGGGDPVGTIHRPIGGTRLSSNQWVFSPQRFAEDLISIAASQEVAAKQFTQAEISNARENDEILTLQGDKVMYTKSGLLRDVAKNIADDKYVADFKPRRAAYDAALKAWSDSRNTRDRPKKPVEVKRDSNGYLAFLSASDKEAEELYSSLRKKVLKEYQDGQTIPETSYTFRGAMQPQMALRDFEGLSIESAEAKAKGFLVSSLDSLGVG